MPQHRQQQYFVDEAPDRAHLVGPLFEEMPAPRHAGAAGLHALWRWLLSAEGLPRRADFTMERIAGLGLLGQFFVIEPLQGGRDWRYRLLGSKLVWLFGRDVTGIPFSQHFFPAEAERCIALSNRVARSGRPLFLRARFASGGHAGELETLSLPIRGSAGQTWLVGASFPEGEAARWMGF